MKKIINYIDLGVHLGDEIDLLLTQYQSFASEYELKIFGIEANIELFNTLIQKYNNHNSVQIFNYAVSDKDDEVVKLYLSKSHDLGSSIYPSKINVGSRFSEVQSIKLSTFIQKNIPDFNNSINVLKLNIEGAEVEVYKDLIEHSLTSKFKLYCGHTVHDIEKVPELNSIKDEYYSMIESYNLQLEYFCAESEASRCINVFEKIKSL